MGKDLFGPVDGVSIETYASLAAAQATGMPDEEFAKILSQAGLTRQKYDAVAETWMARMGQDTSYKLSQIYGAAFAAGGWGKFGAAGQQAVMGKDQVAASDEPVPFKKFCEIQGAMNAWTKKGEDVNAKLTEVFQINALDYSNIGAWWMTKIVGDNAKMKQQETLVNKFEKENLGADAHLYEDAADEEDEVEDEDG